MKKQFYISAMIILFSVKHDNTTEIYNTNIQILIQYIHYISNYRVLGEIQQLGVPFVPKSKINLFLVNNLKRLNLMLWKVTPHSCISAQLMLYTVYLV